MEQAGKSRGGRPWTFDRDQALDIAMRLFWRHGYEGVSIGDLTKAIGIAPPSLYGAFGSKAGLYREAIALYDESFSRFDALAIETADSLAQAVRRLLEGVVRAVTHPDREPGCMISSGIVACHPDHAELARDAAARREAMQKRIADALASFGKTDEIGRLARHLTAVMQGISIQARDGVAEAELREIVEDVVAGVAAQHIGPG
ncbi:TetR/AcrR family transcriptional regulator [Bradyrhizobium prioriisuperbiae]|uniref:TetR/AcrR family transcriptional regulator n=1 Tax=Bradyrhizobium prioriisuperbiae TaxID=2854389 RepID=UPI0028E6DA11|nr:TetR/AcrR family transcriptional regulator [Bradyrhizobium prioritasuperba]